jgi:hypothetical protein
MDPHKVIADPKHCCSLCRRNICTVVALAVVGLQGLGFKFVIRGEINNSNIPSRFGQQSAVVPAIDRYPVTPISGEDSGYCLAEPDSIPVPGYTVFCCLIFGA